jgi:hypothetical protein
MALEQNYHKLWFESFKLEQTSGHRDPIQLKLVPKQKLPAEIVELCESRSVDPYTLLTGCNKDYFFKYPVGTQFLLKAKLTDREGGGLYYYSYYRWSPIKVIEPS